MRPASATLQAAVADMLVARATILRIAPSGEVVEAIYGDATPPLAAIGDRIHDVVGHVAFAAAIADLAHADTVSRDVVVRGRDALMTMTAGRLGDDVVLVLRRDAAVGSSGQDHRAQIVSLHRSTAVAEFALDGRLIWANDVFLNLLGYRLDDVVGRHHAAFCDEAHATSPEYALFWARLRSGAHWHGEFLRVGADGRQVWISATYNPVYGADGTLAKVVKFAHDITEMRARTTDFESKIRAIDRAHAIVEFTLDGHLTHANQNFLDLTGYHLDEILGQPHSRFVEPHEAASDEYAEFWARLRRGEVVAGRFRRLAKLREVWIQASYNPLLDASGKVRGVIKYASDITSEIQLEQRTTRQARTDSLTGVVNRSGGVAALAAAVDRASVSPDHGAAAIFIDLDGFKQVNDQFGHRAGDEVLQRAAERLDTAKPGRSTLARLGGDEFLVVLDDPDDVASAPRIADRLLRELRGPVLVDGRLAMLDGSAGVSVARPGTWLASDLLREADAAVYEAKRRGRGQVALFDDGLRQVAADQRHIAGLLERAIERGLLTVHFQPVYDLRTGAVAKVEALSRLVDGAGRAVAPTQFIDVAERSHLISRLDHSVLELGLTQLGEWSARSPHLAMAVNFSRRHLHDPNFATLVLNALDRAGVPGDRLVVEITETLALSDSDLARQLLVELRSHGVRIALDDFGTGHTSVGSLRRLPIDIVKIDRSFLCDLHVAAHRTLLELMIGSSIALGYDVVAEGIETAEQLDVVRGAGCPFGQGYLLGYPVGPEQVDLTTNRDLAAAPRAPGVAAAHHER